MQLSSVRLKLELVIRLFLGSLVSGNSMPLTKLLTAGADLECHLIPTAAAADPATPTGLLLLLLFVYYHYYYYYSCHYHYYYYCYYYCYYCNCYY